MKSKLAAGIIVMVLGILLFLIPIVIFPVCADKIEMMNGKTMFMKCHWTAMAELLIGILIVSDGILMIVFKRRETRMALSIMLFLFGLAALLLPTTVIGMCKTAAMPCRTGTEPALITVSIIIMAAGIGNILFQGISIKSEQPIKKEV